MPEDQAVKASSRGDSVFLNLETVDFGRPCRVVGFVCRPLNLLFKVSRDRICHGICHEWNSHLTNKSALKRFADFGAFD